MCPEYFTGNDCETGKLNKNNCRTIVNNTICSKTANSNNKLSVTSLRILLQTPVSAGEEPCTNGGSCSEGNGTYYCQCVSGYSGHNCSRGRILFCSYLDQLEILDSNEDSLKDFFSFKLNNEFFWLWRNIVPFLEDGVNLT